MNNLAVLNQQQTMSSREIGVLVESRHDKVKQSIERLVERKIIGVPLAVEYKAPGSPIGGAVGMEYLVCKRDSYIIVAQLSPEFTARLVDRWQELEAQQSPVLDLNDPHALRAALLGYSERVIQLDAKIAADAPKVAFAEVIRAMDGVCHIGDFCKTMRIGRNKLFRVMKADKILMESRMPYQKYIDKGYFSVIEQQPYTNSKGETHVTFTTMVTGAGQVFLAKRYANMIGPK